MLDQVEQGAGAADVLSFCAFLGDDAPHFVLKLFRLLIAESELNMLKETYGVA